MTTNLTNPVTLSYNGYTFPIYTATKVSGSPVYDSSGRTVVAVTYSLTAESYWTVDGLGEGVEISDDMDGLRAALTRPGGRLTYSGNGFGSFAINTEDADCRWGPRPKLVSWRPCGLEKTVHVVWQVEVCIAQCDDGDDGMPIGKPRPPMEYNYQVSYALDRSGYQSVTHSGHVVIATTRRSVTDRTITDHADRLREQVVPPVPPRFRVSSQNFTLSEDKARLNFSVTFEQMPPNVPPVGVVKVSATHTMSTNPIAAITWEGNISATYEMAYHVPRNQCLTHFLDLVRDRLDHASLNARQQNQGGGQGAVGQALNAAAKMFGLVLPLRMQITENIYEREAATLSLAYKVTLWPGEMRRAVEMLGFFRPPPGAGGWKGWSDNLELPGRAMHPRGVAGIRFDPAQDRIIDLCVQVGGGQPIPNTVNAGLVAPPGVAPIAPGALLQKINAFGGELRPENAWIDFKAHIRVEMDDAVVEQPLLPVDAVQRVANGAGAVGEAGSGFKIPYKGAPASLVQNRGKPAVTVTIIGQAVRAGYSISPPEITRVGGVEAIPANRQGREFFEQGVVGNLIYPICVARWRLRYILPEVPKQGIGPLDNPMYGRVLSENVVQLKGGLGTS